MCDFGVARSLSCTVACARTQIGTPYYLCPEVCQENPYAWPADVWSMGCILYELCALRVPFDAPNISGLVQKICRTAAPTVPSMYSEPLRQLCSKMLSTRPDQRPSASDILCRPELQSMMRQMLDGPDSSSMLVEPENNNFQGAQPARRCSKSMPGGSMLPVHTSSGTRSAATEPIGRLCRAAAASISSSMNKTLAGQSGGRQLSVDCAMDEEEEEALRALYLRCIDEDPDVILPKLAVPLKEELMHTELGQQLLQGPMQSVAVATMGQVEAIEKETFSIGRRRSCDVCLPAQSQSVSRIHIWVFNLPGGIVLVDGWSCLGTFVMERENSEQGHQESCPGSRCAFVIPHGEAVTLRVGTEYLTLNPKLCIVCFERPRAVRLPCGHQAFCKQCIGPSRAQLTKCPVCNVPLRCGRVRDAVDACVGRTYAAVASTCG